MCRDILKKNKDYNEVAENVDTPGECTWLVQLANLLTRGTMHNHKHKKKSTSDMSDLLLPSVINIYKGLF